MFKLKIRIKSLNSTVVVELLDAYLSIKKRIATAKSGMVLGCDEVHVTHGLTTLEAPKEVP